MVMNRKDVIAKRTAPHRIMNSLPLIQTTHL